MAYLAGKIYCVVNMLNATYDFMDVPRISLDTGGSTYSYFSDAGGRAVY